MSIKIGSAAKNVVDVVFGTPSSTKKNIDVVKDWNGKIIWQRNKTIVLTSSNTRFSVDSWYESDSSGYGLGRSKPYKSYNGDGHIEYYNGSSWITLTEGTHYTVSWADNRVPSSGTTTGSATGYGKVYVSGKESGGYSGSFYREFYISYTYQAQTYTISTSVSPAGYGSVSGGGSTFTYGQTCTLTATPATDSSYTYSFTGWNDGSSTNPRSFTVTGNASYTANFTRTAKAKTISSVAFAGTYCYYGSTTSSGRVYDPAYSNSSVTVTMSDGKVITLSKSDPGPSSGVTYSISQGSKIYCKYKNGQAISWTTPTESGNAHTIKYSTITISCDGTAYTGSTSVSAYIFDNLAKYG